MDLDPLNIVKDEVDLMDTDLKLETNEFEPASDVDVSTELDPLFLPLDEGNEKFPEVFAAPLDNLAPVHELSTTEETDVVKSLVDIPLRIRNSLSDTRRIIANGRPCPPLPGLTSIHKLKDKRSFVRKFHTTMYDRVKWLTGSVTIGKLFCWPCLLFSEVHSIWNNQGHDNLSSINHAVTKHECTQSHLRSFFTLTTFDQSGIEPKINEQQRMHHSQHNEMVRRNISVLRRLIDTVCLLAKQELPFWPREQTNGSLDKGNYVEELNFLATYDSLLSSYLETATSFRGNSRLIQNDLIESTSRVVLNEIKQEIHDCKFVAIIVDETTNVANLSQISTVLRYVKKDGRPVERFVGFTDVGAERTAKVLFGHVVKIVEEYGLQDKLIAQSYDGAAVMPEHLNDLCARVLERFPKAQFVHCLSHRLDLILQDVCKNLKECRVFFSTLSALGVFLSKSPQRRKELDYFVHVKSPRVCSIECNFSSLLANAVWRHLSQIIKYFEHITDDTVSGDWDRETIIMAQGYLTFLTNYDNCFLLNAFSTLFVHIDVLQNVLQKQAYDIDSGYQIFQDTKKLLEVERTTFNERWDEVERVRRDNLIEESPRKRKRTDVTESPKDSAQRRYLKIIDTVINQLNCRFATMEKFKFIQLLDPSLFCEHSRFLDGALMMLEGTYPHIFDIPRLKKELHIMYRAEHFKNTHPHQFVPFFQSSGLSDGMTEIYRLGCLFLTIPSFSASSERSFSAHERIKANIRATAGQERISSLSLLSIEKELIMKMKLQDGLYDQVISEFLNKSSRAEFEFK